MRRLILYFLILILFDSCKNGNIPITKSNLEGIWLGGAYEIDPQVYFPSAQVLHFLQDNKLKYIIGAESDSLFEYSLTGDSLKLPYRTYGLNEIEFNGNEMSIGKQYPFHYIKIYPSTFSINKAQLLQKSWKSGAEVINFYPDSLIVQDLNERIKKKYCWEMLSENELNFILVKGSKFGCDWPVHNLAYISSISDNILSIISWDDGKFRIKRFEPTFAKPNFPYPEFVKCNPYLYRNYPAHRYGFSYTRYPGGTYALRKKYEKNYVPVKGSNHNGLIRIGFIVNCNGDIGEFDVLELDEHYQETTFNKMISSQLLNILKDSGQWIPGERADQPIDTYKFLSFRIKNGEIDEIFY